MKFSSTRIGKIIIPLLLLITINSSVKAQTTLVAGDIAFSGFIANAAVPDQFSFVLLKAVTSTTVIKFTDFGWRNGTNSFNSAPSTESELTLTISSNLAAGSEITIDGTTANVVGAGSAGTLVHTVGAGFNPTLSFTTAGDQVFAYQGTFAAPVFIAGIHMNVEAGTTAALWDPAAAGILGSSSEKPAALTTGTNALWFTTEHDNARYDCSLGNITTASSALASLNNTANWTTNTVGPPAFTIPTGCNYLGILSAPPSFTLHPVNTTVCEFANTSFTVTATGAVSFQWQVSTGGPFTNLSNDATYSNVTTNTLNITAATTVLNANQYRCVATNGNGSTNSNPATLTVTALPINPTLLLKTPATGTVADGTNVSATFNAGSGGSGCTDDYRYTTNGGVSYLPYTPGSNISTTGLAAGTGFVFIEGRRAGCATCPGNYVALASWVVTPLPAGATLLNAGDIGFTGYASNYVTVPEDNFSFVLLRNIGPGTTVNFTDNGWLSTNVFGAGEATLTWTSNAAYPAGTEIKIVGLTATLAAGGSAGTVTGTALSLQTTGDQILAYRGAPATPTFISAIHMNVEAGSSAAAWDGAVVSTNASALPTGLTTGVNCIWIGTAGVPASEFENAKYGNCANPATSGPITTLRAALNNQANWIRNNNQPPTFVLPTGCPYLGIVAAPNITLNPVNTTVCESSNISFTITATGATNYQWQVNNGGGFVNVTNGANYSGATTPTLNLIATPLSFNGYIYRAIASNGGGSVNSNPATLTVTALPVSPTLLLKTPASVTVADGTPVSATFNAGSGGSGCTDDFRYTTDGGTTYLPYTPGTPISTTGLAAGSGFVFVEGRRAGCATCPGPYTVLAMWRVTPIPVAASTLNAGDIAFSGYTSTSTPDGFSFVLLRNIGPGTIINFTDNGWLSTNVFGAGESTVTWTAPAGGLPGGTEIHISGLTATRSGGGAAGTVTGVALSLLSTGDQVLAYRGAPATPTFISAIHMNVEPGSTNAAWDGAVVSGNASALPTGLTSGVNCIWIGIPGDIFSEHNNAKYGLCNLPAVSGSLVALRAALNNQANWTVDDNTPPAFTLPTGCNYLSVLCPTITVTNPVNLTGTVNVAFSETFTSAGGVPVVTYSTSSTLPTGLTLSSAGVLSGTPTQGGTFPIVVVATDGGGCTGTGATYNLVINCPAPVSGTATPSSQTICSGATITTIVLAGIPGAVYNWTRDNNVPVTGIAGSGTGDISGSLVNTTSAPVTVTFTITPVIFGSCNQTTYTATVIVNPNPDATATPSSQTVCSGTAMTTIAMSSTTSGVIFNWTRDNVGAVTGIPAAGVGGIGGTPVNTTNTPVTVTFTITPGYTNAGVTCTGTPITATLTVNPIPNAVATPSSQSRCSGLAITPIIISGAVGGATFNWVRDNFPTVGGSILASGSGNISGTLVNNTASPITVTFTITPTANSCPGTPITATVTVDPNPAAFTIGGAGTFCQGTAVTLSGPVDPNYTYQWSRNFFVTTTPPFTNLGTAQTQPVTASGFYRLTVTNQFGCSTTSNPDAIVNVADYVFNGSLGAGDAIQTGRINRFAVVSTCAAPKACPGTFTTVGNRFYDSYTITNIRNVPVCATIGVNSACSTNVFSVAYLGSFNPALLCTNYLADPGSSPTTSIFYEATIPANGTIVVIVHEVNTGAGCGSYQLTVDVPRDPSAITATPGTSSCSGLPITLTAPVANTYSWSPGGAVTQSIVHTTGTTNYTVTLGYGNNGCTATASQSVTISNPVVNPVPNGGFCNGASASITFSGTGATAYNWTNTNTAIGLGASGSGNMNFVATNASAAPITATITVTPVNGSCTGTPITFTITVANQPVITSVTGATLCGPGVANLSATGNGIINWWDALIGGVVVNTGTTYSPNVTTTTTYYVDAAINSGLQSLLAMPAQSSTFPGNVRGYWFTAPTDFVITSLNVPTTASAAGQSIAVVKFNGNTPPPVFSATTNAFTTEFLTRNNAAAGSIPCNIPVLAGEVIGILGYRGTNNSYAPGDYNTTIAGFPVQLQRLGMQSSLATTNPQNIWREFGAGTSISRIEFEYSASQNCISAPRVAVTATVKAVPVVTATPSAQTICSASAITTIVLSTTEPGTTYSWTRDNTGAVTGIAASGTTDISGSLTNTTNAPVTVTFTITSSFNGCAGLPITATVVVNPTPAVNVVPNQVVCNGSPTAAVNFSSPTTGGTIVYNWTNNTTSIGLAASGTGNIASFTATNTTNAPLVATITVTPSYTNAAVTCIGTPITFTITVNPTATVNPVANQVVCNNTATAAVNFTSPATGGAIVYNWTNNNPFIGLASVGTGNIASFTATNGINAPEVATITVTPTYTNGAVSCVGTPLSFTITVNPTATVTTVPNQVLCNGANSMPVTFTSPTTGGTIVYNWINDLPTIGLAASGTGNIPTFVAVNLSPVPLVATITVTPTYSNGAVSCVGTAATFTITVNPPPVVDPVASQVVCDNSATANINFTTPVSGGTAVFNWTNNTTSIGLAAAGTGDILSFIATNTTNAPVVATITVVMSYTNGGITCVSLPVTFTITVNPTPDVNQPANQVVCAGIATAPINFTGTVAGTVFNWTNNNPAIGLAATGTGNIASFTALNPTNGPIIATIVVTPVYTNAGTTCTGPSKTFTITVNPTPTVAPVSNKAYCTGATTLVIPFNGTAGGTVAGTVFNWTNDNTAIGLAASGTGDIAPFVTTNTSNGPLVATITVTPVANGCPGTPITFTITVNPRPIVNPVASQTLCNGATTAAINFTSPTTGGPTGALSFQWTNSAPSIGLAANGTGNIAVFTAINTGLSPVTALITVTPVYTNAGIACTGTSQTFTIVVNPTPTVNPVANQAVCNGGSTAAVTFTGSVFGTIYNWTNNNTSIGLAASGAGNIASFTATNATNVAQVATVTVTPNFTNGVTCPGTPITFTITVNPTPTVNSVANQVVCAGATVTQAFTGTVAGTVYNWTNSNTAIGLAASGTGNLNFTATNTTGAPLTGTITVTPGYTNAGITCTGTPQTFTITVNPVPTVNAVLPQVLCNGSATAAVNFTGNVPGTVYNWTNSNTTIGLAASGTGNIASFTATNTTAVVQTATITVTPTFTNGGTTCTGTPIIFTITVNPTPAVNTIANQTVCAGASTTAVTIAGPVAATVYNWTNSNPSIGLAASGTNTIPSFTAINAGSTPVTATITITPIFTNGGISCGGAASTFTITVNPRATVNVPGNQVLCNGATTTAVTFTGAVAGTTYSWTNNNTSIGLAAAGTGNIAAFTAINTTAAPITATITVTPSAAGCAGTPVTFTITVNPTPTVNAIANQIVCAGSATTAITISGPVAGTVYTWTNSNTSIGLGASGTGNIPSFITINPTTSPVTATITVTPVANGCTGTALSFTITVNPLVNIVFLNVPPRVCLTDTILTLSATPGGTWSGPGVSGNTFSAAAAGVGVHLLTYSATNSSGCGTTRTATVVVNDCIERHNVFQTAIRIWPNPTQGRFSIQFNSDKYKEFKVKIVTMRGQEIKAYEFKNLVYGQIIPFNLTSLASGQYYLYVYNTQESGVFPIVIAR